MEVAFIIAGIILAGTVLLSIFTAYIWWHRRQINLPSPKYKSFFLAHGAGLRNFDVWTFHKWAEECGTVYQVHVYNFTFVIASDYRWIREFCTNSKYMKASFLYEKLLGNLFGLRVMGYGLVTNCKPSEWLKHRLMLNPAFHKTAIGELGSTFNEYGERMLVRLGKAAKSGESVNVWDVFGRIAMDIIAKSAFGMQTDMLNETNFALRNYIFMYFKGQSSMFVDPLFQFKLGNGGFIRQVKESCRKLREIGQRCIADRCQLLIKDPDSVPNDALSMLLRGSLSNEQRELTESDLEWIVDEFVTLFIAGHETTALTLAVSLYELERHPQVYAKAVAEVDEVLGKRKEVTFEDVSNLKYIENVLKESLRMYPPAPGTVREVTEKTEVFGVTLPASTKLCLSFATAHMWPEYFENPTEFIPERFESDDSRLPGSYAPFSLGPRICIGKDFAMIEAKFLLAKLLQNFSYVVMPEPKFELENVATLRLKEGVACKFAERAI